MLNVKEFWDQGFTIVNRPDLFFFLDSIEHSVVYNPIDEECGGMAVGDNVEQALALTVSAIETELISQLGFEDQLYNWDRTLCKSIDSQSKKWHDDRRKTGHHQKYTELLVLGYLDTMIEPNGGNVYLTSIDRENSDVECHPDDPLVYEDIPEDNQIFKITPKKYDLILCNTTTPNNIHYVEPMKELIQRRLLNMKWSYV
mgnify:FL=1